MVMSATVTSGTTALRPGPSPCRTGHNHLHHCARAGWPELRGGELPGSERNLAPGDYSLTANYAGNSNFQSFRVFGSAPHCQRRAHTGLLAAGLGRRGVPLRLGPVLRVGRQPDAAETHGRHRALARPRRVLARRGRRWGLLLRRHAVLRIDPGIGLHPAGSGLPNSLSAPIVGIVPPSTIEVTSSAPTEASSPLATRISPGRARMEAVPVRPSRSCPMPLATATG